MSTENPNDQLKIAIEKRDLEMTKKSIENGADVNHRSYWGIYSRNDKSQTPLTAAVNHYPNFRIVQYLISQGANLYAVDGNSKMPIQCSSRDSDNLITALLKEKMRETINNLDEKGNSPLSVYMQYNDIKGVQMLIEMGANVCLAGKNGVSPLVRAVEERNLEIIKYLLENGAQPTAPSALYSVILADNDNSIEYLQTLFNLGEIDINVIFKTGQTPLILSLQHKNTEIATYLIEQGANVDLADNQGNTPLIVALKEKLLDMARKLIEIGCNVNASNNNREIAIKICLENSWTDLAMFLKEKGANVEDEPMIFADLIIGNSEVAEKIISLGIVNVNKKDDDGETVLSKCLEKSHAHLFKRLVEEAGGDINYKNKDGKSLLSLAASKGDLTIVLYLIEKGANVQDAKEDLEEFASWNDSFACLFFSKYQSSAITIKGIGQENGQDPSSVN